MKLVIMESPYAGSSKWRIVRFFQCWKNICYARECVRDCLSRGEAPIASHLLYTQPGILNDDDPKERLWGINAGLAWKKVAEASVVYTDLGISKGMRYGIQTAKDFGIPVEYRTIYE